MKNALLLVILMFLSAFTNAQEKIKNTTIKILPESKLNITGDTNISTFTCVFDTGYLKKAQNIHYSGSKSQIKFKNAILTLDTKGFDCGNKRINKDFHELIQSEQYPEIYLELKEIIMQPRDVAIARALITIAGIQREYKLPVAVTNGKIAHYTGKLELDIKDFNLEPPKKLFGMIVVKDEIEINFNLVVQK